MISPKLYESSHTYDFFMKLLGYQTSIDRFLKGLTFEGVDNCRILDVGCGTGLLGLHFLERFPDASLLATDLEPNFLKATLANAKKRDINQDRIDVAIADVSNPRQLTHQDGSSTNLADMSFDLICIGAVLGYAENTEDSIRQLLEILAPNGYLINIEMNESLTGRLVSHRYHYNNIALDSMKTVIRDQGCCVSATNLSLGHLPAKLTRTAIIARKAI